MVNINILLHNFTFVLRVLLQMLQMYAEYSHHVFYFSLGILTMLTKGGICRISFLRAN